MISAPVLVPVAVGVKVRVKAQLAPPARLAPHVFAWEKSPLMAMLVIINGLIPVLVRLSVLGELDMPTG